jgi:hypothetical protein
MGIGMGQAGLGRLDVASAIGHRCGMSLTITTLFQVRLRNARATLSTVPYWLLARLGLLKPKVRHASGYWRKGVIYIHAKDGLTTGGRLDRPPVTRFGAGAEPAAIGTAILETLAAYRGWVRGPNFRSGAYKTRRLAFLRLLDAKTNAEFMKGGKLVSIESAPDGIRMSPWRNEGARRGFSGMPSETVVELPARSDPEDLGKALIEAFARCD